MGVYRIPDSGGSTSSGGGRRSTARRSSSRKKKSGSQNTLAGLNLNPEFGIPEITVRAIAGDYGAERATSAFRRIMESDLDQHTKDRAAKLYGKGDTRDGGLWHNITHNVVTDTLGDGFEKGMMLIDKPKRAIVASLDEINQRVGGYEDGSSWADKVLREKSYGTGDWLESYMKANPDHKLFGVLDPNQNISPSSIAGFKLPQMQTEDLFGLVGDVGLDPTTYLGAGLVADGVKAADAASGISKGVEGVAGAAKATKELKVASKGAARRFFKAAQEAEAAGDAAKAERLYGLGEKALKRGKSALTEADLSEVGLKGGLRFGARGASVEVIPQDIYRHLVGPLGGIKEGVGGSRVAEQLQRRFGADELADLRNITRDASKGGKEIAAAFEHLDAKRISELGRKRLGGVLARDLQGLLVDAKKSKVDGELIQRAVTGDTLAVSELEALMPGGTQRFKDWIAKVRTDANEFGGREWIADAGEDYMPRFLTDEAVKHLGKRAPREVRASRSWMNRAAKAGDMFGSEELGSPLLHAKFSPDAVPGSRQAVERQMEGLMKEWGFKGDKLFHQNAYETLPRYLKSVTSVAGQEGEIRQLIERGVIVPRVKSGASKIRKNEKFIKWADKAIPRKSAELDGLRASIADNMVTKAAAEDGIQAAEGAWDEAAHYFYARGLDPDMDEQVIRMMWDHGTIEEALAHVGRQAEKLYEDAGVPALAASRRLEAEVQALTGVIDQRHDDILGMFDDLFSGTGVKRPEFDGFEPIPAHLAEHTDEIHALIKARFDAEMEIWNLERAAELGDADAFAKLESVREARAMEMHTYDPQIEGLHGAGKWADEMAANDPDGWDEFMGTTETIDAFDYTPIKEADKAIKQLDKQARKTEARLKQLGAKRADAQEVIDMLQSPEYRQAFQEQMQAGFKSMADYGLPNMAIRDFNLDAMERAVQVAKDPSILGRYMDKVNRFFKTYATMTPGFHVRNHMGATFMNLVAGVDMGSYRQVGRNLAKFRRGGIEAVDAEFRPFLENLEKSGAILWDDAQVASELGEFGGNSKWLIKKFGSNRKTRNIGVTENAASHLSREMGDRVEKFQRTVLAWDTMKKGGSLDEALDKVATFHFDYSDLSTMERTKMKRLIPFWTWTSRNLPLQAEMMLREPKMYQRFTAIKNNMQTDVGESDLTPSWMKDSITSIHLGDGSYFTPDLPMASADDITRGLSTQGPTALLQDLAPIIKAPIELKFGKQAWNGIPISQRLAPMPKSWSVIPGFERTLRTLGVLQHKDQNGNWLIRGTDAYKVEQALPFMARQRRLAPSEDRYTARRTASILSFFGLGWRNLTDTDKQGEAYRRADALTKIVNDAQDRGIIETRDYNAAPKASTSKGFRF